MMRLNHISLYFFVLLGIVGVIPGSFASSIPEAAKQHAEKLRDQALRDETAWRLVSSLTTEIGPRLAGSKKDAEAVQWAKQQLSTLAFDKVWLEEVRFPKWVRGVESARLIAPFTQTLHVTALGFSGSTGKNGLTAEVVHFRTLDDLKAVPDGSLDGKIVFISNRMERHRDGHGYGPAVVARSQGPAVAIAKGASALLIRSIGTDSDRLPHTGMTRWKPGQKTLPAAALSNPDADLLVRVFSYKKPVRLHLVLTPKIEGEAVSHNVIAQINGAEHPNEVVIIGAHLDSWDLGTGAIDDGAGVAITTAAAHLIGASGKRPKRSIRVVLFANEEMGLWGARSYAKRHADELKLHIIGGESDFGAGPIYALRTRVRPATRAYFRQIMPIFKPLGIELGDNNAGGGPDMYPLREKGMPVFELEQDGSDYFDWHHTANDTLDKIDPKNIRQNVAAYTALVWLLANTDITFRP